MRIASRILLFAIGIAELSLGAAAGRAGGLVEFPNLADHAPSKLLGYLARPDAGLSARLGGHPNEARRYPAVVVLHGCGGFSSHATEIGDRIGSWGYVVLAVDSLGPRGIADRSGGGGAPDQDRSHGFIREPFMPSTMRNSSRAFVCSATCANSTSRRHATRNRSCAPFSPHT